MICEKCGTEFFEGRNCPNCNALAIFVKNDEYESRKQEWEQLNKPSEKVEKNTFSIKLDWRRMVKPIAYTGAGLVVIAILIMIISLIGYCIDESKKIVIYDTGVFVNTATSKTNVYDSADMVLSSDGGYCYQLKSDDIVDMSFLLASVSPNGKHIIEIMIDDKDQYHIFRVKGDTPEEIITTGNRIIRCKVNNNGSFTYVVANYGNYDAITDISIYRYDKDISYPVALNVKKIIDSPKDDLFMYIDSLDNVYRFNKGEITLLAERTVGYDYVITDVASIFYIDEKGDLRDLIKDKVLVTNVNAGMLYPVIGDNSVVYQKEGSLCSVNIKGNNPIILIEEYNNYEKINVVESFNKLYFAYNNSLMVADSKGRLTKKQDGIKSVYMMFR